MALVRFRPFTQTLDPTRELGDIQSEVNRLFDSFFGRPSQVGVERAWAPGVDIFETEEDLVVSADLPGLNEKDIHLSITGDMLTIKGKRQWSPEVTQDSFYRGERRLGKFERTVPLPIPVQSDQVKARYREGVLTVKLPKVEAMKSKEIKIDAL
jgi:HSP20 family protein